MVRAERNYPDVYFGRPGSLFKLPYPRGGIDKPYDRIANDFITGSGTHRVSTLIGGSRSYAAVWNALHMDNYNILERFWTGHMGVGPWALLDPSMSNLLTPNQASATSQYNGTDNWATTSPLLTSFGYLESNSNSAHIHRYGATRSLRWAFSVAPATNPIMGPSTPWSGWKGWPVQSGLSYAFSLWMKPDGIVATNVTISARIQWYNSAWAYISESTSGDSAMTTWKKYSVVATPPVGAVYAVPVIVALGSSIGTGGSVYLDEPLFEQDTVVNDWAPGTGMTPVEIVGLTDRVTFSARFRKDVALGLREVG